MTQPADLVDQPHGLGHAKLGRSFWVKWWAAMIVLLAAFLVTMFFVAFRLMDGPLGSLAGGGVVVGFTLALIGHSLAPMRALQKRGLEGKMRPAYRRYMLRFLPAMFGYVFMLIGAIFVMQELKPTGVLAWLAGVAPALPLLLAIRAIVLLPLEEDDEFLREGIYQTSLWATGGALAIGSLYGFLDMFGVVPNVDLWAIFPIWAICLAIAQVVRGRKFR